MSKKYFKSSKFRYVKIKNSVIGRKSAELNFDLRIVSLNIVNIYRGCQNSEFK